MAAAAARGPTFFEKLTGHANEIRYPAAANAWAMSASPEKAWRMPGPAAAVDRAAWAVSATVTSPWASRS